MGGGNGGGNTTNTGTGKLKQRMEIFSHEESMEKRMLYTVPRNIHSLITDITHKNQVELYHSTQQIKQ